MRSSARDDDRPTLELPAIRDEQLLEEYDQGTIPHGIHDGTTERMCLECEFSEDCCICMREGA